MTAAEPTANVVKQCLSSQRVNSIICLKDELTQQSIVICVFSQLFCRIPC